MNLGIIGLDSSHAAQFTKIIHECEDGPFAQVAVTTAYAGGSPDFPLSINRVSGYTNRLIKDFGVRIVPDMREVAESTDAILLLSADGRVHLEQFQAIAVFGKPVFIDKPLSLTTDDAKQIIHLAAKHRIPLMSASSLRYAEALEGIETGKVHGTDIYGPMPIQPTQKHYFWYGIHAAELLFKFMGQGCEEVTAVSANNHDMVIGKWKGGRIGTIRGFRSGMSRFGMCLHTETASNHFSIEPSYKGLLMSILHMFKDGKAEVSPLETLEVIRFLECAEQSRLLKKTINTN